MRDENRGMGVDAYATACSFCWGPDGNLAQLNGLLHRRRANECEMRQCTRAASSARVRSNPFQVQTRPNGERFPKKTFSSPPSGTQVGPLGF